MFRILAAVALAALAAVALVGPGASAQGGRTISLTELEKGATFKHVRNTKPKSRQANRSATSSSSPTGSPTRPARSSARTTPPAPRRSGARNFAKSVITCNGSLVLRDGTMTWQGTFTVGASTSTEHDHRRDRRLRERPRRVRLQAGQPRHARHDHPGELMSVSANRTAVDVAPHTARPGLALLLAVLAVPGSTVAWDLPLGGLWIGLPLAVAAIVLGVRARLEGDRRWMATAAIVLAGLCLAQMAIYTIASSV